MSRQLVRASLTQQDLQGAPSQHSWRVPTWTDNSSQKDNGPQKDNSSQKDNGPQKDNRKLATWCWTESDLQSWCHSTLKLWLSGVRHVLGSSWFTVDN